MPTIGLTAEFIPHFSAIGQKVSLISRFDCPSFPGTGSADCPSFPGSRNHPPFPGNPDLQERLRRNAVPTRAKPVMQGLRKMGQRWRSLHATTEDPKRKLDGREPLRVELGHHTDLYSVACQLLSAKKTSLPGLVFLLALGLSFLIASCVSRVASFQDPFFREARGANAASIKQLKPDSNLLAALLATCFSQLGHGNS